MQEFIEKIMNLLLNRYLGEGGVNNRIIATF